MRDRTRAEIEAALKPGGSIWFNQIVDQLFETTGGYGLIENKLLALDFGLDRPDFAALPIKEQLYWMQAARVEIDHRGVEERVQEIIDEFNADGVAAAREQARPFAEDIQLRRELTERERDRWIKIARKAAAGRFSENELYIEQERRVALICDQPNRPIKGIYFITSDRERVKIGFATDVLARLRNLETGSPKPFHLMLVIPGEPADERALHRRFANIRVRREWFRLTEELARFIADEKLRLGK